MRIAVIGAGIAGITAAYLLARRHEVTLIERNSYLGGHTNTVDVSDISGKQFGVDTGFIVCNPVTYPNFYRLLNEWGAQLRDSDMSFGYYCEPTGLGYVGPSLREFSRRWKNFLNPRFLQLIFEQQRFNRRAAEDLESDMSDEMSLQAYLKKINAKPYFIKHYLIPLAAAVWSSPDADMFNFPAKTFIRFFSNHGLLKLQNRPVWQTVVGRSRAYVEAFRKKFRGTISLNQQIQSVRRQPGQVTVQYQNSEQQDYDCVVLATHADQSLAMLANPSTAESEALSAWTYHNNSTMLHTDASVLPSDKKLWASWNYLRKSNVASESLVSITYYMNRLQGLEADQDYFVSLNAAATVDANSVIYETQYMHPAYTSCSVTAQKTLRRINGSGNTYYCGSYLGYGFHEDAVVSAIEVAGQLGVSF